MTDAPPLSLREEDEALAAEYVLGVLDMADRAAAERRVKTDSAFAALVVAWEQRLSPLNDDFEDAPAPNLLPQIEARLFPKAPAPSAGRGWLGWLAGGLAVAAVALAFVVFRPAPQGQLLAVMATSDASLSYDLRVADGNALTVTRTAGSAAPDGQVHELWIIAPGAAPVSLGLLEAAPLTITYPVPPAGWTFAVSLEPAGGSPTGAPTGPVLMAAELGA